MNLFHRFLLSAAVSPYVNQIKISYDVHAIRNYIDSVDVITNSLWTHKKRRTGKEPVKIFRVPRPGFGKNLSEKKSSPPFV